MKKIFTLFLLFTLTGCSNTPVELEEKPVITEETLTDKDPVEPETSTDPVELVLPDMPVLPDLDFSKTDFFEDGYLETTLISCTDGDTARFDFYGENTPTRFLAIDTPETSNGVDPWGFAAKAFTCTRLQNAEQIILEFEPESGSDMYGVARDNYNRLLAWIWVDGELLQYKLVEESLAWVKYLYGEYKYNPTMIQLEGAIQDLDKKIWGEDDPDYNYEEIYLDLSISDLRDLVNEYRYANQEPILDVTTRGVITGIIGYNAFIQDEEGSAIYIYTNNKSYNAIKNYGVGTFVELTASFTNYNGLDELSNIKDSTIIILEENYGVPDPLLLTLAECNEQHESKLVRVEGVVVEEVQAAPDSDGYSVIVSQNGTNLELRIDKYVNPPIPSDTFEVGQTLNVVGNLGQYLTTYQIMIRTINDIEVTN